MATEQKKDFWRNIYCPHHEECLDRAARVNLKFLDCENCPQRSRVDQERELPISSEEIENCRVLLQVIFKIENGTARLKL